jgi:hypothetical protein
MDFISTNSGDVSVRVIATVERSVSVSVRRSWISIG